MAVHIPLYRIRPHTTCLSTAYVAFTALALTCGVSSALIALGAVGLGITAIYPTIMAMTAATLPCRVLMRLPRSGEYAGYTWAIIPDSEMGLQARADSV